MKQDNNFQRWYDDSQNRNKLFDIPNATEDRLCAHLPNRSSKTLLETAFEEAKAKFAADLTQDRRKTEFASLTTSLRDLQDEISKLVTKYEARNKESKARKWLERLSHRIHFYGTVLDVVAQHHPEYVALTWGSIKFLILVGAVINHEKVVTTLAKAISQIADLIPHVELQSALFPTALMKKAVIDLYAVILRFLIRARDWYDEGKFQHLFHSITRPVELRYNDLLEQISLASQRIKELATAGHLAEFRDMHKELKETKAIVERISNATTLHSSALINTNRRISDLQFSNIMASLSHVPIWEPMKVYQYYNSVRRRMSHKRPVHTLPNTFWRSSKLRHWSSTPESALSVIAGNFQARFLIRNLCVDIIEQLHRAAIPVILAMKVQEDSLSTYISHTDLLKYLIRQALQIRDKVHTEKSMSLTCAKFHDSTDEAGWFQLFEATLADIGSLVYIIVDLVILDKSFSFIDNFSWIGAFEQFFETLINRKISTKVKVLLVCYGSLPIELSARDRNKFVIPAKADSITARQRKFARAVKSLTIRNKSDSST